jgi:hypothetical protein
MAGDVDFKAVGGDGGVHVKSDGGLDW